MHNALGHLGKTVRRLLAVGMILPWLSLPAANAAKLEDCYAHLQGPAEEAMAARALYIIVDQTTPLDGDMKARIRHLVADWGRPGDLVKVARFSAHMRGHYPEVVFAEQLLTHPSEAYLYNLRYTDKQNLLQCLERRRQAWGQGFEAHLDDVLEGVNYKTPKTDLLYSLRELANQMIRNADAPEKTVLIVSDGLENSGSISFYRNGGVRSLRPKREINLVRKKGLMANWKGAEVYMYGIGLSPSTKAYINPRALDGLREFWERYFVEGNAVIKGLGTPELLVTTLD